MLQYTENTFFRTVQLRLALRICTGISVLVKETRFALESLECLVESTIAFSRTANNTICF